MYKNGATPNKEALHGAFLLNKHIFLSVAQNKHFDDFFRYGIMFPVSIGDAMFIRGGNDPEDKK